jgi:uncharacterized membrane protein (UPF0182 family)
MRATNDMPRRRTRTSGRGRVLLIILAVVVFIIITSLRQVADFWTDYLWFDSVNFSQVWTRTLLIKVGLGAAFTAIFFAALWANLAIADRISPKFRPLGPEEELLNRYHQLVDRRAGLLRVVVAGVFAIITGAGMSSQWNEWLLFYFGGDFDSVDSQFGLNVGFYTFKLPFLMATIDWLFAALVIIVLITAVAHYLNGGIRLQAPFERVTPQVKAHLSVLLALLALTKAADYWLQRYQILFSQRGAVAGATYTEVNAQLPALYLLLFIALASFVLFIANIRRRGWVLPIVAVGLWALVQIVVGEAYPAIYQRLIVQPEESTKEASAIHNNIHATRAAYGLDKMNTKTFDYSASDVEASQSITNNPDTIRNIQLLDTHRIGDTFQKLQSQVVPLQFARVTTDRYLMRIPGGGTAPTQVVVANREMNADNIPGKTWENQHLNYTHGYGLALAAGNAVTQGGAPDFSVKDRPLQVSPNMVDLQVDQPNNYFFNSDSVTTAGLYSVVDSGAPEFDFVRNSGDPTKPYAGSGGVPLNSLARRAAFFLKFNDFNLLISNFISDQSRILFLRDIRARAQTAAPFLAFDGDPYPVVVKGRTFYVLDAYTTSEFYPNSQPYPNIGIDSVNLQNRPFNYVRNSVKAVIDTYDGSIKYYVIDKNDPVIAAYQQAFPELFTERAEMEQELRQHLRYPEDIFRVQTDVWGRYHITDPADFYKRDNAWEPPPAPQDSTNAAAPASVPQAPLLGGATPIPLKGPRLLPNYVINQLPGDSKPNFMLLRSFQPFSETDSTKNKLTAFMVARCDDDDLGRLDLYQISDKDQIEGPAIASAAMLSDRAVSERVTLLGTGGSRVMLSDLMLVPLDKSILYVRSLYVVSENNQVPVVRGVIVDFSGKVFIDDTLKKVLQQAFPASNPQTLEGAADVPGTPLPVTPPTAPAGSSTTTQPPATSGTTVPSPGGTDVPSRGDAAALVEQADKLLQDAVDGLRSNGNLGEYQAKVDDARRKIQEAHRLTNTTTTAAPPSG